MHHEFHSARSNIHISFDMWTSPNCYTIMTMIVAHYINSSGICKINLIALQSLDSEYTGENIADLLLKVFQEYKIGGYIDFFILDNVSANNTCVDLVLQKLYLRMNTKQHLHKYLRYFE